MFRCFLDGEARFLRRCFVWRKSFSLLGDWEMVEVIARRTFIFGYKKRLSGITVTGGSPPYVCSEMELSALAVDFDAAVLLS